jgi:hypothetical protein
MHIISQESHVSRQTLMPNFLTNIIFASNLVVINIAAIPFNWRYTTINCPFCHFSFANCSYWLSFFYSACWSSTKRNLKINLSSPWYSWKIAELALSNNHSIYGFWCLVSSNFSRAYKEHHISIKIKL